MKEITQEDTASTQKSKDNQLGDIRVDSANYMTQDVTAIQFIQIRRDGMYLFDYANMEKRVAENIYNQHQRLTESVSLPDKNCHKEQ